MIDSVFFQILSGAVLLIGAIGLYIHRESLTMALLSIAVIAMAGMVNLAAATVLHADETGLYLAFAAVVSAGAIGAVVLALNTTIKRKRNEFSLSDINEMKG